MLCKQLRGFQEYDIVSAHVSSLIIAVLLLLFSIILLWFHCPCHILLNLLYSVILN